MSKRFISILLVFSLLMGMSTIAMGESQLRDSIILNGVETPLEEEIYTNEQGKLMIPLRDISEKLGYIVGWNGAESLVTLSKGDSSIRLKINDSKINVNNKDMSISLPPIIKAKKAFIPLELFSNILDLIIGLDDEGRIIKINEAKENKESYFTMSKDKSTQNKLDTYMKSLQKHENFHGSLLVAKEGEILLNEGYGFADLQQNTSNKSQTRFAIGSVTKQFTAMGIMQLSEKGLINVEDKVSKYIGDCPNGDLITIHNLLTHTSGLKNYTDLAEFFTVDSDNKDPMAMINLIKDMPLEFQPGEEFRYSNTNYLLLGMIIENITNMSLEDYLEKNIFDPLNMNDTGMSYGEGNKSYDATAYSGYLEVVPVDDEALSQSYGAGNMYSTVEDLYRWDRALETEKLVKKSTMDEIFKEHIDISELVDYGYGWMISDSSIGNKIFHGGNTLGFTANIVRYTDEDMTIVILTNNGYYNVDTLTDTLTSITLGEEYKMPVALKEIEINNPDLYDNYVGKYELIPGTHMNIIREGDKLYAQATGQGAFEIFPETESKFFAKSIDVSMEFVSNDEGEITQIIFEQMGMKIVCNRVEDVEKKEIVDIDPVIYYSYVGEYELAPGVIISIIKEENQIFAQMTGQDKYEIFPMSESEYFYKVVDAKIGFVRDENGIVTNLILYQNGQEMVAPKIK